jgi:hypothetical protein
MAHREGTSEQTNGRLGAIEQDLRRLRSGLEDLRTALLSRIDRRRFWLSGLLIVSIGSPIAMRAAGH